jgi:hypothetical protein
MLCTNHPGWWDPLVFLTLGQKFAPQRMNYGPIEAKALGKYGFLERIGFIGIEPGTWRGSARFLRMARAAAHRGDVFFWVTAQGSFTDPRVRPTVIRPGIGHAVAAAAGGLVVPFAVEYPYWNERLPEALAAFGTPFRVADAPARRMDRRIGRRARGDAGPSRGRGDRAGPERVRHGHLRSGRRRHGV